MLNSGTNVNVCDNKNKSTPLHLAVNQGNDAGVKALLASRHCDVNCQVLNVRDVFLFSSGNKARSLSLSGMPRSPLGHTALCVRDG